ncbi:MAG: DUF3102 domain-containing protein [Dysosmobacter sp.]|nr:DUF3102 domain-containing protein [Dysosmobacter sp.]
MFDISKFASEHQALSADRSIETITTEILTLKQDAGNAILGIGQRLNEARAILPEGEWLQWLTEQVDFSPRTAQRFMRLAREWSDATALSHLGATKALTLLALPPEERQQFIEENHIVDGEKKSVIDMTSRELEKAIRERDDALKAAEVAKADAKAAEDSRSKMEADMAALKNLQMSAQNAEEQARRELESVRAELKELQEKPVEVAVMEVDQDALEKARAEAVAGMQDKLDRAKAARDKANEKLYAAEKALADANAKLEAAKSEERKAAISGDRDLATFELLFNQAQEVVNKLHGLLLKLKGREDTELAGKVEKAMLALADATRRCAE